MKFEKMLCIIIITIFLVNMFTIANPIISAKENMKNDQTKLDMEFVSSGFNVDYKISELFGISAVIRNNGKFPATDVQWSISLSKLIAIGKTASGIIPILYPNDEYIIKIPLIFGFGKTQITATSSAENANATLISTRAKITGFKVDLLPGSVDSLKVNLEKIADHMKTPTYLTNAGDETNRIFVTEQTGKIFIINNGVLIDSPFLDISNKLVNLIPLYDERGLLGLAFHPDYKNNGKFYVYYTAPTSESGFDCKSIIAEYQVSTNNPNKADPNSEKIILSIEQPEANHNGGQLAFGPDGYLYIGVGDGGGEGDEHGATGNGQNINTLLGKILRIDIDNGEPYAIPLDNPFIDINGSDEIYAYGFRNPFRFSFEKNTGRLFVGDVGQDLWEEIDIVEKGGNYGWRIMEGNHLYDPSLASQLEIDMQSLIKPIYDYSHYVAHSVIGGYVYHGLENPDLVGKYVFGDWSSTYFQPRGKLFYLEELEPNVWNQREFRLENDKPLNYRILGIGQDESGELYVLTQKTVGPLFKTGEIWHIVTEGGEINEI